MRVPYYWLFIATLATTPMVHAEGVGPGDWAPTPSVRDAREDEEMDALSRSMEALDQHRCDPSPFSPNSMEKRLASIECRLDRMEKKLSR